MPNLRRNIDDLPIELIEEIFYHHVCINFESRKPLLCTCRTWYSIATNYGKLWGSITLGFGEDVPPNAIRCKCLKDLAKVVSTARTAAFALCLGQLITSCTADIQPFLYSVDRNWLSRCRFLTLSPQYDCTQSYDDLAALFHLGSLEGLEGIHIRHGYDENPYENLVDALMAQADASAMNLRTLRIQYDDARGHKDAISWVTRIIYGHPGLLCRISMLHLSGVPGPVPWSSFYGLTELRFCSSVVSTSFVDLEHTPLRRLNLVRRYSLRTIAEAIWTRLTHLTLTTSDDISNEIHLPHLIDLSIIKCRFDVALLNAPILERLTIRIDEYNGTEKAYPLVKHIKFTPRIINIDFQTEELGDDDDGFGSYFVRKDFSILTDPYPVWGRVEDLHLTMKDECPSLDRIHEALSGTSTRQCYPSLRCLTVLWLHGGYDEASIVKELKKIMEERVNGGMRRLEVLKTGWTYRTGHTYNMHPGAVRVKWIDCLLPYQRMNPIRTAAKPVGIL